ncbi:MAG TPA: GMC family oxidoreductase [Solirubrobacterales bacterium]|nr:GMC family oxidoreductase [Solirubrobacterales bacterium]
MSTRLATALRGSRRPADNDSAWLLDRHRRAVPGRATMARFAPGEEVDMVIVGCGAGGATLAQRLARRGWRIVVLEAGPFWDPDEDWVSDEAGSHDLYWNQPRVIGGSDPVELGKNNSGRGVGGSMVHFAGFVPRFHPTDFEVRTRDGVAADWPLSYAELRPHYERVERELPAAGEHWPWGDPHGYPHAPHPVAGGALRAIAGARRVGIEFKVGPVAIADGSFGNRPHCIYRGLCLQGCKVNAKGSPLVTHVPDALAHGVEIRDGATATRIEVDEAGRAVGVTYVQAGVEHHQRAATVAVAGYSIETPRLLLHSTSPRFPRGLANGNDLVGRGVMVQGAPQVAGRFPEELRMYKAPPPEIASEQFYETDPARGFVRGFSLQTVGPLPIGWAEHVLADGHWGQALREYMRDYNHWYALGALCELLPRPDNRVTLAAEADANGVPIARLDYSQCDNDRANIACAKRRLHEILEAAGAQDVLTIDRYAHLVGGCAMSASPATGVVDADHRAWEVPNLFVADGSVMPTQGSANPALTIMALASRLAARLADGRVDARPAAARGSAGPTSSPPRG